eukprot:4192188-Prymnesium_polylepis.1
MCIRDRPKIKKDKYPAVSEAEEAISIPLQALCIGVFDAILVHMLNTLSPTGGWQRLKQEIIANSAHTPAHATPPPARPHPAHRRNAHTAHTARTRMLLGCTRARRSHPMRPPCVGRVRARPYTHIRRHSLRQQGCEDTGDHRHDVLGHRRVLPAGAHRERGRPPPPQAARCAALVPPLHRRRHLPCMSAQTCAMRF